MCTVGGWTGQGTSENVVLLPVAVVAVVLLSVCAVVLLSVCAVVCCLLISFCGVHNSLFDVCCCNLKIQLFDVITVLTSISTSLHISSEFALPATCDEPRYIGNSDHMYI